MTDTNTHARPGTDARAGRRNTGRPGRKSRPAGSAHGGTEPNGEAFAAPRAGGEARSGDKPRGAGKPYPGKGRPPKRGFAGGRDASAGGRDGPSEGFRAKRGPGRKRPHKGGAASFDPARGNALPVPPAVAPADPAAFAPLGLDPAILTAIGRLGYSDPTPIQREAIPHALEGRDVVGLAQTGTGKTAAFGLPLVQVLTNGTDRLRPRTARSLILAPTRELATQIAVSLNGIVQAMSLSVQVVVGGMSLGMQAKRLERGADILVATPGRLLDLVDRGAVSLREVRQLVLDEADQMLDLGFIHDLKRIASLLGEDRRTMLFSATMPTSIESLAARFLTDPVRVETAPPGKAADKIEQRVYFASAGEKPDLLIDRLQSELRASKSARALVFCRTKRGAEKLMKRLVSEGLNAASIHGNKSQGQRDRALNEFRGGRTNVLVATDVAARGIDIPAVTHVYNFELPHVAEAYVHRIGRTARAGADGEALAFCAPDEFTDLLAIERLLGMRIETVGGTRPERGARAPKKKTNGRGGPRAGAAPRGKPPARMGGKGRGLGPAGDAPGDAGADARPRHASRPNGGERADGAKRPGGPKRSDGAKRPGAPRRSNRGRSRPAA